MKIMEDFYYGKSHHMLPPNQHFAVDKDERKTLVIPNRMH